LLRLYGGVNPTEVCPASVIVHTDGSCKRPHTQSAQAGAGIYFGDRNALNCCHRVPGEQTNNRAELYAILIAIQLAPLDCPLDLYSDSQYAIKLLSQWAPALAKCGWSCTNGDVMRCIMGWIRARSAPINLIWIKGHSGNMHNDEADKLA
ncbi:ribonuclease H-like protein, partial [Dendrothele bispora CBS 962.96]